MHVADTTDIHHHCLDIYITLYLFHLPLCDQNAQAHIYADKLYKARTCEVVETLFSEFAMLMIVDTSESMMDH